MSPLFAGRGEDRAKPPLPVRTRVHRSLGRERWGKIRVVEEALLEATAAAALAIRKHAPGRRARRTHRRQAHRRFTAGVGLRRSRSDPLSPRPPTMRPIRRRSGPRRPTPGHANTGVRRDQSSTTSVIPRAERACQMSAASIPLVSRMSRRLRLTISAPGRRAGNPSEDEGRSRSRLNVVETRYSAAAAKSRGRPERRGQGPR